MVVDQIFTIPIIQSMAVEANEKREQEFRFVVTNIVSTYLDF